MFKNNQNHLIKILRWTERYTGTDMVYLAHGSFWLSIGQFAISISGFLLTIILANTLSPEKLGEYRFLISGFTLMSILALPGMRTAIRESTPKGYLGNLVPAFNSMFKWGLIGSLISVFAASYYFIQGNINLSIGFIIIAFAVPVYNASTGYLEFLTALKKLRLTTFYTTLTRVLVLIFTAIFALIFPNIAWLILFSYLFSTILPNLFFHFRTVRTLTKTSDSADPDISRYAGHITAMTALGVIAGQLDKLFIWNFIGAGGLAIFYVAYTLPQAVSQYLIIIPTLAFAKFGEKDPRIIRQTLLPKILKYLFVITLGTIIYIIIAPYLFMIVFPQYPDAIIYSQVLVLMTLFSAFMPIKTYLTTTKQTKALYILSVIPSATRIVVAIILIAPLGLWGAVYSLFAEGVIRTALLLLFFIRSTK